MKFIVLSDSGRESLTLNTAEQQVKLLIAAVVMSIAFAGAALSYFLGAELEQRADTNATLAMQQQSQQRQREFQETRYKIDYELSALTAKVAMLQARIMRLDALGEQLAQTAKLDNGEFDFSQAPALGGPSVDVANGHLDHASELHPVADSAERRGELYSLLQQLEALIADRENQLSVLNTQLMVRDVKSESFVAGRPVKWGWMSSAFGFRTDPFNGKKAWHNGVDFAGKSGSDVIAVAGGVVTASEKRYGYGNLVEINHGDGFVTRYGHNESNLVAIGDVVEKGQTIAKMGSTGRSTGSHVHFEVLRNGKPINPERYIYRRASL